MYRHIKSIIRKEFKHILRDRRTIGILVFIPAFMLILFGYAVNFDVKNIPLAYFDDDNSAESRALINSFVHSGYFDLKYVLNDTRGIPYYLDREMVRIVIVIPKNFSNELLSNGSTQLQIIVDGANASAAATVVAYIQSIVQDYSIDVVTKRVFEAGGETFFLPLEFHPRVWFNPELQSSKFLIPGLIAFILMVTAVVSTALSIVREKEKGTMEQLYISPVNSVSLIIGKTIPYTVTSLVTTALILIAGYLLFGIRIEGDMILLSLVIILFLITALGWGLFISTISETQQIAFMIAVITTMLPTFVLSGFVFPIHNMPAAIQFVTYIVPARYFLEALRAVMLKGAPIIAFWDQLLILAVFAMGSILISSARLWKRS